MLWDQISERGKALFLLCGTSTPNNAEKAIRAALLSMLGGPDHDEALHPDDVPGDEPSEEECLAEATRLINAAVSEHLHPSDIRRVLSTQNGRRDTADELMLLPLWMPLAGLMPLTNLMSFKIYMLCIEKNISPYTLLYTSLCILHLIFAHTIY